MKCFHFQYGVAICTWGTILLVGGEKSISSQRTSLRGWRRRPENCIWIAWKLWQPFAEIKEIRCQNGFSDSLPFIFRLYYPPNNGCLLPLHRGPSSSGKQTAFSLFGPRKNRSNMVHLVPQKPALFFHALKAPRKLRWWKSYRFPRSLASKHTSFITRTQFVR